MKKKTYRILAMLLAGIMLLSSCKGDGDTSSAIGGDETIDNTSEEYYAQFNNLVVGEENVDVHPVLIGSGGYITGLLIHPKNSNVMYVRTDVGGAYRWEEETKEWTQICWSFQHDSQYSIDGFALDPNDENIIYLFVGNSNMYLTEVFKSTDKGETWTTIGPDEIMAIGNGKNRELGECIVVDPNNSDVIALGTRGTGFFVTENGGETWMKINVAGGSEEIRVVLPDATSGTVNGRTKVWYTLVLGKGLYKSTDGTATWTKMEGVLPEGEKITYNQMNLDKYGRVYITYGAQREGSVEKFEDVQRGLIRINKDGSVTDLAKNLPAKDGYPTYLALDVDYDNPNRMVVGVGTGVVAGSGANAWKAPIYYTNNGGATWTNVTPITTDKQASGWKGSGHISGSVASLTFGDGDELWMTDWSEVYYTPNVSAAEDSGRKWRTYIQNIEELVSFTGISVPDGLHDIVVCSADSQAFALDDETVKQYPTQPSRNDRGSFQQSDYCVAEPNFIVGAHTEQNEDVKTGSIYYSYDGGYSWTRANALAEGIRPGNVAVSSDTTSILVMATLDGTVLYSYNRGRSWTFADDAPSLFLPGNVWHGSSPLESDKNKGNIFYLMSPDGLYRSENWGKNWTLVSEVPEMGIRETGINVQTIEGSPGEIWIKTSKGIYYSADYGNTVVKLEGLRAGRNTSQGMAFSVGAGKTEGSYTIYFQGVIGTNEYAIYYSEDKGKTWIKSTNYEDYTLAKLGKLVGSYNQYGRVYLASSGMGWSYIDTADGVRYNESLKAENTEGQKAFMKRG